MAYYFYINMSSIGIYNTRYEGGECYAACMETYTLYLSSWNLATTLPSPSAGKDAIMLSAESTTPKAGMKPKECANDSPPSPCSPEPASSITSKTSESTAKCSPLAPIISTELAYQVSEDRNTERHLITININSSNAIHLLIISIFHFIYLFHVYQ